MVNFNNETTVGTAAVDINRVTILQRRYDFIEGLEDYRKKRMLGVGVSLSVVKARLFSLFLELQAYLKRTIENYEDLLKLIREAEKEEELLKAFYLINEQLDSVKLTRIDLHKVYDPTDAELEDEIKGF